MSGTPVDGLGTHRDLGNRLTGAALVVAAPVAVALIDPFTSLPIFAALICLLAIGGATTAAGLPFGLAAAVTSFTAFSFYFTGPRNEFGGATWEGAAAAALFGITAVTLSVLIGRERRARAAANAVLEAAEGARERAERLQSLAAVLSEALTPQEVLDATLSEGVAAADARAGLLAALSEDGQYLQVIAQHGYPEETVGAEGQWHRFPVAANLPLSEAVRTRKPVFISSQAERNERYPELGNSQRHTHAVACMPLVVEREAIGGLVFSFATDTTFDVERRRLKMAIANQVAQALGRARLYEIAQAAHARSAFLAEATAVLASSLDYEQTLGRIASLAVPGLADWCAIDMVGEDGAIERLTVAHQDPAKVAWARQLQERFPPNPDDPHGVPHVLRTGVPEFMPEIPAEVLDQAVADNPELAAIIAQLGLRSFICVPLKTRGGVLGALSLVAAESGRTFREADVELATELADRAAVAVDNARLYRESERRGDAARALAYTADGAVLVDQEGRIRFWNPAAERLTGIGEGAALGRPIADVLLAWPTVSEHILHPDAGEPARPATLPLTVEGSERWLSVTAVEFGEGSVYALRDVTEELALEQARSDFVATASHELRTPIAAVYGAVRTLRRPDIQLSDADRELFLQIIETEGERLGALADQILVAGQIDADTIRVHERPCDVVALAEGIVASTRLRVPKEVELELDAPPSVPPLGCDEDKLRQVLVNLVENAVKYSPDGGRVTVAISTKNGHGRIAVQDEGLGIPTAEQDRIFEKFYRLDPSLTRGVGGSGLGLYISRELVERMHGKLTVASEPGRGSTFTVELPTA